MDLRSQDVAPWDGEDIHCFSDMCSCKLVCRMEGKERKEKRHLGKAKTNFMVS